MLIRAVFSLTVLAVTAFAAPRPTAEEIAMEAQALMPLFSDKPVVVAPLWQNRAAWEHAIRQGKANVQAATKKAEKALAEPIPPWPEEAYYDFTKNGDRERYQRQNGVRRQRLTALYEAELLEGKGRFIPAMAETLDALCADKTWVDSAHDRPLTNISGKGITISLGSSLFGWRVATLITQFGDALPEATRDRAIATVRQRVINPYLKMVDSNRFNEWWVTTDNNWNAVCHAGVVGAALALPGVTPAEKARIIASAKLHIRIYLGGFERDGWCGEGIGYWSYGFVNFASLAETVRGATGGKEDWLLWPEARLPARAGHTSMIEAGLYPTFSDCSPTVKANPALIAWLNARLGWQLAEAPLAWPKNPASFPEGTLFTPDRVPECVKADPIAEDGARCWFPDAEVLIERGKGTRFSAVIKGGHNGVSHNHNDVGSFMVVAGGVAVLTDAGGETYTSRTFSSRRYESDLLNSYGHPVPFPAQILQKAGRKYAAKILKADFTPETDTLLLDLAPAYASSRIETLTRSFIWSRARPCLTLEDTFAFADSPEIFETALITFGACTQTAPDTLRFTHKGQSVAVKVEASAPWALTQSTLTAKQKNGPVHRIALALTAPAQSGFIRLTITP